MTWKEYEEKLSWRETLHIGPLVPRSKENILIAYDAVASKVKRELDAMETAFQIDGKSKVTEYREWYRKLANRYGGAIAERYRDLEVLIKIMEKKAELLDLAYAKAKAMEEELDSRLRKAPEKIPFKSSLTKDKVVKI